MTCSKNSRGEPLELETSLQDMSKADLSGPEKARLASKVEALLSMSKIDKTKCSVAYFRKFNKMIEYELDYALNVIPYLKYFRNKLFVESLSTILDAAGQIYYIIDSRSQWISGILR